MEQLDQVFVSLKHWIVAAFPEALQPLLSALVTVTAVLAVFAALFALTTLVERKALGRIQNRLGPNRVGPFGLLQPLADGLKMLTKEDIVPTTADRVAHFLAPIVLLVPVALALAVLPYGRNMAPIDLDAGILFFFAIGGAVEVAVFMAGWSSRNKYSLLGAMRAIAQMISYEVPLVLSTVAVVMIAGSLSLVKVVEAQSGYALGWIPNWHVLTPWGLAAFLLFLVAATAESNRSPFDLPEAESEIIAGYLTEYSGFKYALFFLGEYWGLFAVSGLAVTLFLGGWTAPLPILQWIPSYVWFFGKLGVLVLLFIWLRGTLPRLRIDQLMNLAWKFMLPMSLINIMAAGLWHFSANWTWPLASVGRWLLSACIIAIPYVLLGRALAGSGKFPKRVYQYAT
ncbi:MAG: NADH-quinone oxidoreductase subunit NuoH [Verrucomicrobiales bacterium]|nr:NADH-quinone oxidoreductase subunit NuoH [Verrucomicrobiales bacterium]